MLDASLICTLRHCVQEHGLFDKDDGCEPQYLTTKERIKQDRDNQRLGLSKIQRMSHSHLVGTVQSICRQLNVSNAAAIETALSKLLKAMQVVPQLEEFVSRVS